MPKHPRQVEGYDGSLEQLAAAVGHMTYDQTAEFIGALGRDLRRQGEADRDLRGRDKLANRLFATADLLEGAEGTMSEAWDICEPHMPASDSENRPPGD
jgi:hypothetical protein